MCRCLGLNRTSFYAWERRPPSDRALEDAWLTDKIKQIHRANRGVYGSPRIHAELRIAHGIRVGRKRVERLMRTTGISGLAPRRRGRTTIRVPGVRVADDLVERRFRPAGPNVLWVADITCLRSWARSRRPARPAPANRAKRRSVPTPLARRSLGAAIRATALPSATSSRFQSAGGRRSFGLP
jgi:hypothetical protein